MENQEKAPALAGRVAVVTGAGGVLGSSFARCLARAGARVALVDLHREKAEAVAAELRAAGCPAAAFGCNVLDQPQARFETELEGFHRLLVPRHQTAAGAHRGLADGQLAGFGIVGCLGQCPRIAVRVAETCEDAVFLVVRHLERAPVDHLGPVEQGVRTCREAGIPVSLLVRTVAIGLAV